MYQFTESDYRSNLPEFVFVPKFAGSVDIYSTADGKLSKVETVDATNINHAKYETSLNLWQTLPEASVFDPKETKDLSTEDRVDYYCKMLVGVALIAGYRAEATINQLVTKGERMNGVIDWLCSAGFFHAPASSIYHHSFPGGLLEHTLDVVFQIHELGKVKTFRDSVSPESAVKVALVHDWCKIGLYEQYMRNVKNEDTGVWEKVPSYRIGHSDLPFGHGVESLMKAQSVFKLSTDEALAIRWHMGEYNVAQNEMNDLHQANEKYPLVQMLQFADRLAAIN